MIKVEGFQNLYRDPKTNAIVNTDERGYKEYLRQKSSRMKQKEHNENLETQVDSLQKELAELKELVQDLLSR